MRLDIIIVGVLGLLLLGALGSSNAPKTNDPFPMLTATSLRNGERWSEQTLQGRVTLVQVFASWCPHCAHDVSVLTSLKNRFPAVRIVGIVWQDDDKARLNAFLENHGNPYHSLWKDSDNTTGSKLNVTGVPMLFVVDGNGLIRAVYNGRVTQADVEKTLTETLKTQASL